MIFSPNLFPQGYVRLLQVSLTLHTVCQVIGHAIVEGVWVHEYFVQLVEEPPLKAFFLFVLFHLECRGILDWAGGQDRTIRWQKRESKSLKEPRSTKCKKKECWAVCYLKDYRVKSGIPFSWWAQPHWIWSGWKFSSRTWNHQETGPLSLVCQFQSGAFCKAEKEVPLLHLYNLKNMIKKKIFIFKQNFYNFIRFLPTANTCYPLKTAQN